MTVSEYIYDFLEKKGCKNVFMVSGSSAMWLTDALKRNERLNPICCQHEQAAAMAADGQGRITGLPGVCLVTIGPGATNAITGVAGAYLDSSPMIVLSGQANSRVFKRQQETGVRQKGTQSLSLENMVKDITKYFAVVENEKDIRFHLEKAYYEAVNGRKGPVWLDVPVDIQNKQVPDCMTGYEIPQIQSIDLEYITQEILEGFINAKKPLIMAGYGVLSASAKAELGLFIEKYKVPVVTSRGGIGVISSDNPYFIGRPGNYGDRASHFAIQESDFILILGSRLSMSTVGYYPERFGKNAKKIMIDIDEKELENTDVIVDQTYCVDAKLVLQQLLKAEIDLPSYQTWVEHCQFLKEKYPVVLDEYAQETGLNSYYFTKSLSEFAPEDATLVVDTGSVCNVVSQSWYLKSGQNYIISGGFSCMGFWANALGAAALGHEVIALSGDGSTQMNIQELATLKYYNLPVKLFVYNNRGYMLIRHNQHNYMNDRFLGVGPDSGVPSVDFCKVAEAYQIPTFRIECISDIQGVVKKVFDTEGPVVCEVMVQEFGVLAPRIASRVMPDGSLKAAEFDDLWPFIERVE